MAELPSDIFSLGGQVEFDVIDEGEGGATVEGASKISGQMFASGKGKGKRTLNAILDHAEQLARIDAWVVLPDHLHCVWTLPRGDADFSSRWGAIKARFTRAVKAGGRVGFNPTLRSASKVQKGDAGLWQRRFWEHHIRDAADHEAHVRYCWLNPVKHGLAARPAEWPHSSIHRDIRLRRVEPEWSAPSPDGRFGE